MNRNDMRIPEVKFEQLGLMYDMKQFSNIKLNTMDIKCIEKHLDIIDKFMTAKRAYYVENHYPLTIDGNDYYWDDLETIINIIITSALTIYKAGGFDILKNYIKENGSKINE